jgi:hypothetical protein
LRLYCNGSLLTVSYIVTQLHVTVEQERDGRWRCEVVPAGPVGWAQTSYTWEVDAEGAVALLPPAPSRKAGRKSAHNWMTIVDLELRRLQYIGSPLLENFCELETNLLAHLRQETGQLFKRTKRFRQRIRAFLRVQN